MKFVDTEYMDDTNTIKIKCDSCGRDFIDKIPQDVIDLMRKCGCSDHDIVRHFKEHRLENSWFCSFSSLKCDICGESKVLCWVDGCSPSGVNVISPSDNINFWPGYDYPEHDIKICKWCMPDNKNKDSRDDFLKKLFTAMQRTEDDNWEFKEASKNNIK
jgi:hypothetical protein